VIDRTWETWAAAEVALMPMREAGYDPACKGCRTEHETAGKWVGAHTCEGSRGMFRRPSPPTVPPVLTGPQWLALGRMLAGPVLSGKGAVARVHLALMKLGLAMFAGTTLEVEITPAGRAAHDAQSNGGVFLRKPRTVGAPS
jgi:hypothetical protein